MPRTKAKGGSQKPVLVNGAAEVLTLAETAAYLRLPEAAVLRLVKEQGLPGRQTGNDWRFLLAGIRDWLKTSEKTKSNSEVWRELEGVWKDDPFFDEMHKEINKERARPRQEDLP